MAFLNKGQKKAAEPGLMVSPEVAMAVSAEDLAAIEASHRAVEAEKLTLEDSIPEGKRFYKLKEIKIDQHTIMRKRVLLTDSMCRERGCGFDAAVAMGYAAGWESAPIDQKLPSGITVGEAMINLLKLHSTNGHAAAAMDHIVSEDELNGNKTWVGVSPHLANLK